MALKKSELYSSLWSSCDELRGGMDAGQYKDYVLVMLFIKYISDKSTGGPYDPVTVPKGSSFQDMVALKGTPDIGLDINTKIIGPVAEANGLSGMPDFNDPTKLGSGKEMVDRLTNLIAIFERKELDFSKNRAEGDDILGDAYEYLMRHFAAESGKSKGQFYTPAEVSRVMAKIIGVNNEDIKLDTTVYDPTCGSGSLLLKVADEAEKKIALKGQEKDSATAGLAHMNMILHGHPDAEIKQGNTLANPLFLDNGALETFDYVVANPPFSDKSWTNGVNFEDGSHGRFTDYGIPPDKNVDYAYLLHIIRSLKSKGKGACILPHGVLFRGNAEADIRAALIEKKYIKGIIGLPPNLFYGTGIPACIIVIDKENTASAKGVFMLDAGKGFIKDGNKNRLRDMDIHKIVDVFNKQAEIAGYSRMVPLDEIEKNEHNLNIPRYIDSRETEDIQDIEAHLRGGAPSADIDALGEYWEVCPNLRESLFSPVPQTNSSKMKVDKDAVKQTILEHSEFKAFTKELEDIFAEWKKKSVVALKSIEPGFNPKKLIFDLSESLLAHYTDKRLVSKYDVYQRLMDYWEETMRDDCHLISADGWKAETHRILVENKKKKMVDKGWACDLIPKELVVNRFFAKEKQALEKLETESEKTAGQLSELEEKHNGEDGAFSELEKFNKANVNARLKEIKIENAESTAEEKKALNDWKKLYDQQAGLKKKLKTETAGLDEKLYAKYPTLTEDDVKTLTVDDKWMTSIEQSVCAETDRITQKLTQRIKELAERYEKPLPEMTNDVAELENKVNAHLKKMGFVWK